MEIKKRGGARPGAGRKKTAKLVSFRLKNDLAERILKVKNKSQFYNEALKEKLDKDHID